MPSEMVKEQATPLVVKPLNKVALEKEGQEKRDFGSITKSPAGPSDKVISDTGREPEITGYLNTELLENNDKNPEDLHIPEITLQKKMMKTDELNGHKQPDNPVISLQKDSFEFIVEPSFSEPGHSGSRKNSAAQEKKSVGTHGVLRSPQWPGDWKTGRKQINEIEATKVQSDPTIKVNIGRIEVRTLVQPAPSQPRSADVPKPKRSLDDYLNRQNPDQK